MRPGRLMYVSEVARPEQFEIRLDWSAADEADVKIISQVLVQLGNPAKGSPDGIYVALGDAPPPIAPGDNEDERQAEMERYGGKLPVTVHGRYFLTRARLDEVLSVLQQAAQRYDEMNEGGHS